MGLDLNPKLRSRLTVNKKLKDIISLTYPLDLQTQPFYPESIKFTVYKRHGASLQQIKKTLKNFGTKVGAFFGTTSKKQFDEQIAALEADRNAAESERAKSDITEKLDELDFLRSEQATAGNLLISEGKVVGDLVEKATAGLRVKFETQEPIISILLNMPNEITFTDDTSWEGTDLGAIGGIAKGQVAGVSMAGFFSNFSNVIGGGTGALTSLLLKLPGGAIGGGIIGSLGGEGLQKTLESGTGVIGNPYKEMTFSGIGFRNFSFNFVFRARNESEVEVVQDIIETFRYNSKPTYNKNVKGASFLNYPQEFRIEFLTKNEPNDRYDTNPYIPEIKMCVCKSITTNFSSQNTWRSLKNGAPVEISLGLSFEETELITGEDVIGETKIGRYSNYGGRF